MATGLVKKSASTFAIAMAMSSLAWAQNEGEAPTSGASAYRSIDEIMVTALKREKGIQDVPLSVTAITGDLIEESGIGDLSDLAFLVPNFQFNSSSQLSNARINVRGVTSVGNSAIEPSVGVFVDGAYVPRPGAVIGNLYDIEQIEVLRGPQGTLFGRNTPVGALTINTKRPEDEFGASLSTAFSDFDDFSYKLKGHVTGPITDGLKARVALLYDNVGGYLQNGFSGQEELEKEEFGVRGRFVWDVSSSIEADLVVDYHRIEHSGAAVELLSDTVTTAFTNRVFNVYGATVDARDTFDSEINQIHTDDATNEQWGATLNLNIDIGDHTLTSVTSYRDWTEDQAGEDVIRLPADLLTRKRLYSTENVSQELRIASPGDQRVEYVAGLFFYKEDYAIDTAFDLGTDYCNLALASVGAGALAGACNAAPENAVVDLFSQELISYAVFGQATLNVTDRLALTGGLRWTRDEKTDGRFRRTVSNPAAGVLAPANENTVGLEQTAEAVNWLLGAQYDITDDVMMFVTASTGFKSGGFNSEPGASSRIFDEENSETYEVGFKSAFFDNRVVANATLFQTEVDDFQERQFQGLGFIVDNAGSLRQRGVEADIQATPLDELDIAIGASFLDSEFTDFQNAPSLPGGAPQDLTGQGRQDSPKWQFSLASQWTDRLGSSGLEWFVRGEYQYIGKQFLDANLNPQSLQESYGLANFRIGLGDEDQRWKVVGFVRNAFDEGYCVRTFNQVAGGLFAAVSAATNESVQRCVVGRPRSLGLELSTKF